MIWRWFKRDPMQLAREYLVKQRYGLLGEQVMFAAGLVDFVARHEERVVLIKVRARGVLESKKFDDQDVDGESLVRLFAECRRRFELPGETPLRFDVLRLDWYGRSSKPVLRYFPGAVTAVSAEPVSASM